MKRSGPVTGKLLVAEPGWPAVAWSWGSWRGPRFGMRSHRAGIPLRWAL